MHTNEMPLMTGPEVKAAREARGLGLKELADVTGIDWRTLKSFENGQRSPRAGTIRRLMEMLAQYPELPKI